MPSHPAAGHFATLHSLHKDIHLIEFILQDDICTLGRSSLCDIALPQQKTVSRLHAKIEREGPRYVLRDANSANGTYVNEQRIFASHLLQDDDVIGLGLPQGLLRFSDPDPTDIVQSLLHYDNRSMTFFLNQHPLDLTANEFHLLYHLYQHGGDICTRKSCSETVWKREYDPGPDDEGLDRLLSNVRRKMRRLADNLDPTDIIKTRRGLGYELKIVD